MDEKKQLKQLCTRAFVRNRDEQIGIRENPNAWIWDFRRLIMNGEFSDLLGKVFWQKFSSDYPFQIGGLEVAAVPIVTSLVKDGYAAGRIDCNGFFVRKSRKKIDLLHVIEGTVVPERDIILVDDLINTGSSFWRQIVILEELGYPVKAVWSILRFRDDAYYRRFHDRGIAVHSIFSLDDFTTIIGPEIKNLVEKETTPPKTIFTPEWTFKSKNPSLNYVRPKSQPIIDDEKIYFGADNRIFWALNQDDGSVAWQFIVGPTQRKKAIFSNPALYERLVIFGAYDGTVYALDKESGEKVWEFLDADWVGSSPAIDQKRGVVFIGLEFGLLKKQGGIVALAAQTGKKLWCDYTHTGFTHASPLYIPEHNQVAIGSNDGKMRLYNAKNGKIIWSFTTFGGADYNATRDRGFGAGDIKESAVYDVERDYLIFGSVDGFLYILNRKTGHLIYHHKCHFGMYSTPCIHKNRVYFTSVDKYIRCLDLNTLKLVWEKNLDNTRIFSSPVIIDNQLFVGTNAGCVHQLDPKSGERQGYLQTSERITNSLVYNTAKDLYFLPTYANELIALKKV
jgi:outer membrane protein assembly factor BamB